MGTRSALAKREGVSEEMVAALALYAESPYFTAPERAALRLADLVIEGERPTTTEIYDEAKRYYDEAALVDLGLAATLMSSLHRLFNAFNVPAD